MDDHKVYLEKLSAFSRMLRLEGISVSPQETADACRILLAMGLEDRQATKQALSAIYAKSREEQYAFSRVFDGFFLSEEAMRAQANAQAQQDLQREAIKQESQEQLQVNGQPMLLSEEQREAYASMTEQQRQKLLQFLAGKSAVSPTVSVPVTVDQPGYYVTVEAYLSRWRWWDGGTRYSALAVVKHDNRVINPGADTVPDESR